MIKKLGSFLCRNLKRICIIFLIIALAGLVGILSMNSLINNERPVDNNQSYKALIGFLKNVEANGFENINSVPLLDKQDSLGIVITDQIGNIAFKKFNNDNDAITKGMTKFNVFSDLGGFIYVFDQNNNFKYLFYGKLGHKNLRTLTKNYNNSQPLEWNNFFLSSINDAGMKMGSLSKVWINSDGDFSSISDGKNIHVIPYAIDTLIVKSDAKKFNLYYLRAPHLGLFDIIIENSYTNFIMSPFDTLKDTSLELREILFTSHFNTLTRYQVLRDLFLVIMLASLIISLIFAVVWVFIDARKRNLPALPWSSLVLITNLIGFIIYLIIRQSETSVDKTV